MRKFLSRPSAFPAVIAFDADDTLWHNEGYFRETEKAFRALLASYHDESWIQDRLFETETRNLAHYGYGVKSFVLSMIETAIQLTEGRITAFEIEKILAMGREMLDHPVSLLPHVKECLEALSGKAPLWVITKGDLLDQESKLARSGLGDGFELMEVMSEKTPEGYRRLLELHGVPPASFLMVGNSVKSDILPVLALGGRAVHIPYEETWEHEKVDGEMPCFPAIEHMGCLEGWIANQTWQGE